MRMMVGAACALLLTACTPMAERARAKLPGMPLPAFLACAGLPDRAARISGDDWVLGYSPGAISSPSVTGAVPILGDLAKPTVTVSGSLTCRLIVRASGGRVMSVHYVAASSLLAGPNAACAPLVRDCLLHADQIPLPAGYQMDDILANLSRHN